MGKWQTQHVGKEGFAFVVPSANFRRNQSQSPIFIDILLKSSSPFEATFHGHAPVENLLDSLDLLWHGRGKLWILVWETPECAEKQGEFELEIK